jgi:hypothetical protein
MKRVWVDFVRYANVTKYGMNGIMNRIGLCRSVLSIGIMRIMTYGFTSRCVLTAAFRIRNNLHSSMRYFKSSVVHSRFFSKEALNGSSTIPPFN